MMLLVIGGAGQRGRQHRRRRATTANWVIAAWPSFALTESYELTRQVRHSAVDTREDRRAKTLAALPEVDGTVTAAR